MQLKGKRLEVDFICNLGSRRYYIQSAFAIPDQEKINTIFTKEIS